MKTDYKSFARRWSVDSASREVLGSDGASVLGTETATALAIGVEIETGTETGSGAVSWELMENESVSLSKALIVQKLRKQLYWADLM